MPKVLVLNDDVTTMEFVARILQDVFEKPYDEALKILLEAHNNGRATCGVYTEARARELAEHATAVARRAGFPLQFSVVDADSSG